ncbi:hypothetical protein KVR01_000749 [Diaporthe batatas]|uniref:uncharacterized protein n=1 Tax=Diaporthe batatas TaxID=748121 RepID=UPI001D05BD80|nr:uncharacterized protein KVR01_000749 [Diaporthe batatas]KAG8170004.1 hypothetical protein KVR01_000749 [Diaporthe batatas]
MAMGRSVIILTGAPEADRLDWDSPDLLQTFQDSIAAFAGLSKQSKHDPPLSTASQDRSLLDIPLWRSLSLQRTHIPTGFSQYHDLNIVNNFPSSADFLTTAGISFDAASQGLSQDDSAGHESKLLAEWYEHSLALHDDLVSSQLVPHDSQAHHGSGEHDSPAGGATETSKSTSFLTTSDEGDSTTVLTNAADDATIVVRTPLQPGRQRTGRPSAADHLSDLEDIPPARYLESIRPQTMTVTLIAGIISIAAPRAVETRFGSARTLVEVLVGDETKSGFSVTFWLPGGGDGASSSPLAGLRAQDIVLMRNVALNVFRGKVYGGSLPRGMTGVYLLHRGRRLGPGDDGGHYAAADLAGAGRRGAKQQKVHPQLDKTRRVRDWVLRFVGGPGRPAGAGDTGGGGTRRSTRTRKRPAPRDWNLPPPLDSQ